MATTGRKELEGLGWTIKISNVVTGATVYFQAFVADFTDQFVSTWNKENIYGRMDPIVTFQNVQRKINLSFDVPSDSMEEARNNLAAYQDFVRIIYPTYDVRSKGGDAYGLNTVSLSGAPVIRVEFANMISSGHPLKRMGLMGVMDGSLDFRPDMDNGWVTEKPGLIYPKIFRNLII